MNSDGIYNVQWTPDPVWSTSNVTVTVPQDPNPQWEYKCLVCGDITHNDHLCELCRQAVLLFRRKVLEQMARELLDGD